MELIILFLIITLLTKRQSNVLGCGLIGFAPNKKNTANLDWIKLIMTYNAHRGTDSCGLFMNDTLVKGVGNKADIRNFMAKTKIQYDPKCKNRLILAHSRKSTYGSHTEENAHPFFFEHEGKSIIFAHNGTITNATELAHKYDVDVFGLMVDSQKLAKIILEKGYSVLNDYKGSAALLFTYSDDPGVMYIFKGASRDKVSDANASEERPLYYIKNNEGIYLSSMREPLDAASNQDLVVYTMPENIVCKIINNEIFEVEVIKREDANIVFTKPANTTKTTQVTTKSFCGTNGATQDTTTNSLAYKTFVKIENPFDIYNECAFANGGWFQRSLLFIAGRHYIIPNEDFEKFKEIGFTPYMENADMYLAHGEITICKPEYTQSKYSVNPYVYSNADKEIWATSDYYYQGVLIRKDKLGRFKGMMEKRLDLMTNIFEKMKQLSSYSTHPITFTYDESQKLNKDAMKFYFGGNICKEGVFGGPYGFRKYTINANGVIKGISSLYEEDSILIDYEEVEDSTTVNSESDFDKMSAFAGMTNFSYFRYKGLNYATEVDLIMEEECNGAADVYYYCYEDENISISGTDIKKVAIEILVSELVENGGVQPSETFVEDKSEYLYEQGMKDPDGLEAYLNRNLPSCNYMEYFTIALLQIEEEVFEDFYEDQTEDSKTLQEIGNESLS
jgi:hypothetical protein